jgi:hypothetical protein
VINVYRRKEAGKTAEWKMSGMGFDAQSIVKRGKP